MMRSLFADIRPEEDDNDENLDQENIDSRGEAETAEQEKE